LKGRQTVTTRSFQYVLGEKLSVPGAIVAAVIVFRSGRGCPARTPTPSRGLEG
jgi:hypothetical protein